LPATKHALHEVLEALSGRQPQDSDTGKVLSRAGVSKVTPDDFVLLAFSCHGDTNLQTGEYYLFPSDIGVHQDQGLTADLQSKGISTAELTDWLRDVDAGSMVMIIDSCHSAAATRQDFKPGPMDSPGLGQLAYYKQLRLLSAAKANRTAKETDHLKHGLLTYSLVNEGLDQRLAGTGSRDGAITLQQWLQFAVSEVPRLDEHEGALRSKNSAAVVAASHQKGASLYSTVGNKTPQQNASRVFQTPSLLDFSRNTVDLLIIR
jgi:uncharacterized caspase-like protein